MKTIRASSTPLAFACPASLLPVNVHVREENDGASVGTAAHEALAHLAEGRGIPWDDLPAMAERHGVDLGELRMLCAMGIKLWSAVSDKFSGAVITELELRAELPGVMLTGHADVISLSGNTACIGDWKTGRKDSDYTRQMESYAVLLMQDNPQLERVTSMLLWVRECEVEHRTMTRARAVEWIAQLGRVVNWDGIYRPGTHCAYCPRSHECEAANALARRDAAAILDVEDVASLATMAPEKLVELAQKASLVAKYAGRVRDTIKAHVEAHGDIVGGTHRLTLQTENRRQLDPIKAWPVLESLGFDDADFAACVTIGVSKVEDVVKGKAGKGHGASAVRALSDSLTSAGATTTKTITKMVEKRN